MEMTLEQKKAMAKFHRRAERAYRSVGNIEQAERARKLAEKLEAEIGAAITA